MKKKVLVVLTMSALFLGGSMNTFAAGGRNFVDQNQDGICDFYGLPECMGRFCGGLRKSGLRVQSAMQNIKDSNAGNAAENAQNVGNDVYVAENVQNAWNDAYAAGEISYQCPACGIVHDGSCIYGDGTCLNPDYDGNYGQYCGDGMGNGAGAGMCYGGGNGAGMGHHGRHGR